MDVFAAPSVVEQLTHLYTDGRSSDGRPQVRDEVLERMRSVSTEEAWKTLWQQGYRHQYEGGWMTVHPDRILVGRAVTAAFVPHRPDLHELVVGGASARGRHAPEGGENIWVIDALTTGDVLVADMFGKVSAAFLGDNLATTIATRTGAGAVIDGAVRDYQGLRTVAGMQIFCRGVHPSFYREVTPAVVNGPVRIGGATVLPGDVVLGTPSGVVFIPPHLALLVVERSEDIRLRDTFSRQRLEEGRYPSAVIEGEWTPDMLRDFEGWRSARG